MRPCPRPRWWPLAILCTQPPASRAVLAQRAPCSTRRVAWLASPRLHALLHQDCQAAAAQRAPKCLYMFVPIHPPYTMERAWLLPQLTEGSSPRATDIVLRLAKWPSDWGVEPQCACCSCIPLFMMAWHHAQSRHNHFGCRHRHRIHRGKTHTTSTRCALGAHHCGPSGGQRTRLRTGGSARCPARGVATADVRHHQSLGRTMAH